jgi:hypothetical protein
MGWHISTIWMPVAVDPPLHSPHTQQVMERHHGTGPAPGTTIPAPALDLDHPRL